MEHQQAGPDGCDDKAFSEETGIHGRNTLLLRIMLTEDQAEAQAQVLRQLCTEGGLG